MNFSKSVKTLEEIWNLVCRTGLEYVLEYPTRICDRQTNLWILILLSRIVKHFSKKCLVHAVEVDRVLCIIFTTDKYYRQLRLPRQERVHSVWTSHSRRFTRLLCDRENADRVIRLFYFRSTNFLFIYEFLSCKRGTRIRRRGKIATSTGSCDVKCFPTTSSRDRYLSVFIATNVKVVRVDDVGCVLSSIEQLRQEDPFVVRCWKNKRHLDDFLPSVCR